MFIADGWNDFRVLDAGNGMKLERWKGVTLLRPDPQAVWPMGEHKADAIYIRSETGGGHWEEKKQLPESWQVPKACPSECTKPTIELEKAIPAMVEACASSRRPNSSVGWSSTLNKLLLTFLIAAVA